MTFARHFFPAARRWRPPDRATPPELGSGAARVRINKRNCTGHNTSHPRTRLPAYGRTLLSIRERGRVPDGVVIVSAGLWLQDQAPLGHLLVVPDDAILAALDFSVVAALSVCIVHDSARTKRALELVNPIIAVDPCWLAIADLERRTAATVFELGAECCWRWGAWEWGRFDGARPLTLPRARQ